MEHAKIGDGDAHQEVVGRHVKDHIVINGVLVQARGQFSKRLICCLIGESFEPGAYIGKEGEEKLQRGTMMDWLFGQELS